MHSLILWAPLPPTFCEQSIRILTDTFAALICPHSDRTCPFVLQRAPQSTCFKEAKKQQPMIMLGGTVALDLVRALILITRHFTKTHGRSVGSRRPWGSYKESFRTKTAINREYAGRTCIIRMCCATWISPMTLLQNPCQSSFALLATLTTEHWLQFMGAQQHRLIYPYEDLTALCRDIK